MEENLIGYALDALDEPTKRQVEQYLAESPSTREKLALVRQALAPLGLDAEPALAPKFLVERTLSRIAEHICTSAERVEDLPVAPPVSQGTRGAARSWRPRADVLVAACLLITVTGVGLMLLERMRGPSSVAMLTECKNNLRLFYGALQKYRDTHGQFPDVAKQSPRDVAGMVVPILSDAGTLPTSASIRCPGLGTSMSCELTLAALRAMNDADFEHRSASLSMCYAYSLGYRDQGGTLHGPGDTPQPSWSQMPIMADRPPVEGVMQNSVNHDGTGQNVLFADGHVRFLPKRTFGADNDIFLNRADRVAAGLDATDIVLGYSAARP